MKKWAKTILFAVVASAGVLILNEGERTQEIPLGHYKVMKKFEYDGVLTGGIARLSICDTANDTITTCDTTYMSFVEDAEGARDTSRYDTYVEALNYTDSACKANDSIRTWNSLIDQGIDTSCGLVIYFARGDLDGWLSKKDGMACAYGDYFDWKKPIKNSDFNNSVYFAMSVNRDFKSNLNYCFDGDSLRLRKRKLDYTKLAQALAPYNYIKKNGDTLVLDSAEIMDYIRSQKTLPTVDLVSWSKAKLVSMFVLTVPQEGVLIEDRLVTTGGNVTVGIDGDFTMWSLLILDLGNFTSDLDALQITAISETSAGAINEDFGAYKFTIRNPNGYITTMSNGVWFPYFTGFSGTDTVNISGLRIKSTGATRTCVMTAVTTFTGAFNFYNNIFDGGGFGSYGAVIQDADPIVNYYNNIVHNTNLSGIFYNAHNASSKYENNTIYDCGTGIENNSLTVTHTNTAIFNCTNNFATNTSSVSNYCATDKIAVGGATDNSPQVSLDPVKEFESTTSTDDYFLQVTGKGVLFDGGTTPSITENTAGINGNPRPSTDSSYISIGASQILENTTNTDVFFSVGIAEDTLFNDSGTLVAGVLTFDNSAPDNIGVGDAVYINNTVYTIAVRTSSTVYTIQTPKGSQDVDYSKDEIAIMRYANLLSELDDPTNFDVLGADLVTNGHKLNLPMYADGKDSVQATFDGWTTSRNACIKIFSPYSSNQVGITQRHSGVWDETKQHMIITTGKGISLRDGYVGVFGLQIKILATTANDGSALYVNGAGGSACYDFSNNIFVGDTTNTFNYHCGVELWGASALVCTAKVYNNVVYDFIGGANSMGMVFDEGDLRFYVYNNTIYNCDYGISTNYNTLVAKNNIVTNITTDANTYAGTGTFQAGTDYNSTNGSDVPGGGGSNNRNNQVFNFVDLANRNFNLASSDTGATKHGEDLSSDTNLYFNIDIANNTRVAPWDVGAFTGVIATTENSINIMNFGSFGYTGF